MVPTLLQHHPAAMRSVRALHKDAVSYYEVLATVIEGQRLKFRYPQAVVVNLAYGRLLEPIPKPRPGWRLGRRRRALGLGQELRTSGWLCRADLLWLERDGVKRTSGSNHAVPVRLAQERVRGGPAGSHSIFGSVQRPNSLADGSFYAVPRSGAFHFDTRERSSGAFRVLRPVAHCTGDGALRRSRALTF